MLTTATCAPRTALSARRDLKPWTMIENAITSSPSPTSPDRTDLPLSVPVFARTCRATGRPRKRLRVVPSTPPTDSDCSSSGPTRGSRYSALNRSVIARAEMRFEWPSPEPFLGR